MMARFWLLACIFTLLSSGCSLNKAKNNNKDNILHVNNKIDTSVKSVDYKLIITIPSDADIHSELWNNGAITYEPNSLLSSLGGRKGVGISNMYMLDLKGGKYWAKECIGDMPVSYVFPRLCREVNAKVTESIAGNKKSFIFEDVKYNLLTPDSSVVSYENYETSYFRDNGVKTLFRHLKVYDIRLKRKINHTHSQREMSYIISKRLGNSVRSGMPWHYNKDIYEVSKSKHHSVWVYLYFDKDGELGVSMYGKLTDNGLELDSIDWSKHFEDAYQKIHEITKVKLQSK